MRTKKLLFLSLLLPFLTACGAGNVTIGEITVKNLGNTRYTYDETTQFPVPNAGETPMEGVGYIYPHFSDNRNTNGTLTILALGDENHYKITAPTNSPATVEPLTLEEMNEEIATLGETLEPWISRYGPHGTGTLNPNASNPPQNS